MKQVSVFLENKPGQLAEVMNILKDTDIRALSLADTRDFGVLRLITCDAAATQAVLKSAGVLSAVSDVIAVSLEDHPGALAAVIEILSKHDVPLEYLYAFVTPKSGAACVILKVHDNDHAREVLTQNNIKIVSLQDFER